MEAAIGKHLRLGFVHVQLVVTGDDAEVWNCIRLVKYLSEPTADHGRTGSAGDCATSETDGVVAEEQRRTDPA